jgi:oligopeptide transport system ATP-binding protein
MRSTIAAGSTVVSLRDVRVSYRSRAEPTLRGVTLTLSAGETLGVVGESGCGKTTLLRSILGLIPTDSGAIEVLGGDPPGLNNGSSVSRVSIQLVHQDPFASLNPRMTICQILQAPLRINGCDNSVSRVRELLDMVGLSHSVLENHPAQLSGGQRQRVAIARALSIKPKVLLLDEPVSALDVSVQAQVINLINDLQRSQGFSCIFVSHDLTVVAQVADRIAVMYLGQVVEIGETESVLQKPEHPYSMALAASVPSLRHQPREESWLARAVGEPSREITMTGCSFRTRCWMATSQCDVETPSLDVRTTSRLVACHHPLGR